eukprot:602606-Alexandrium_andersonii.AAC.1
MASRKRIGLVSRWDISAMSRVAHVTKIRCTEAAPHRTCAMASSLRSVNCAARETARTLILEAPEGH